MIPVTNPETNQVANAPLEQPSFMVTASDEIVLLRAAGGVFFFDIRDTEDGSPLGFFDFSQLTDRPVFDLKFLKNSDRNYLLTTIDPEEEEPTEFGLLQVQLTLNDEPVVIEMPDDNNGTSNNGTNNNGTTGLPDAGTGPINADTGAAADGGTNAGDVDAGCGCATVGAPPAPLHPATLLGMIALGATVLLTRRR